MSSVHQPKIGVTGDEGKMEVLNLDPVEKCAFMADMLKWPDKLPRLSDKVVRLQNMTE